MHLRFVIVLVSAGLIAPAFAQDKKGPTLDELVTKNIEAKGGQDALRALQSLRLTGKMLINQGQIEFGYLQTKKRPGEVRTEATLQGMTAVQAYDGKKDGRFRRSRDVKIPRKCRRTMRSRSWKTRRSTGRWWIGKGSRARWSISARKTSTEHWLTSSRSCARTAM